MNLVYTHGPQGSTATPPAIPGKYVNWPDAKLRANPPPQPQKPLLSVVYPLLKKAAGPASVA